MKEEKKTALLIIDLQNDFVPGGTLAVKGGDKILGPIKRLIALESVTKVVATKDFHPEKHVSFASTHGVQLYAVVDLPGGSKQVMWPNHCVQGTGGTEFIPGVDEGSIDKVIYKGRDIHVDSYSGFFDNEKKHDTGLDQYLHDIGVEDLVITGLATDYCVFWTVMDALDLGYSVSVIKEATAGVDGSSDWNSALSYQEMKLRGVLVFESVEDYLSSLKIKEGASK